MDEQEKLMIEEDQEVVVDNSWMAKILGVGAVLGALTGLGAAYLLVNQTKKKGELPDLDAGEGIKLALLLFGLLRQVAMLGNND